MAEGSSETPAISSSLDDPVIQILLMGRKASGKSSSGNTILGQKLFKVHIKQKEREAGNEFGKVFDGRTRIGGKEVHVIDCPDLLDPDLHREQLKMMKEQLVSRCSAGLSAVLLVVPLVRKVDNEEEILDYIRGLFGPKVQKYIMILFTREDELQDLDETIDEHLQNSDHTDLLHLVTVCGGKFHCFNNKSKSDDQRPELLQKIEEMMIRNGGKFTTKQIRRASKNDLSGTFSGEPLADVTDMTPERKNKIRLVLLGKTGSGKSATGNTIIGRNIFKRSASSNSQTKQCQSETVVRMGKEISVIDTPGLFDTKLSKEEIITEIAKCITYSSPGPHAFIIVIRVGRFTEEEKNTILELKEMFGEQIGKYTMILFTHKDQLEEENETIEQYLQNGDSDVKKLVDSCRNQFFCLNNKAASFPQFKDLISVIDKMVEENGGHFTNDLFKGTEKLFQKQKLEAKFEHLGLAEESRHDVDVEDLIRKDQLIRSLAECFRRLGDKIDCFIEDEMDSVTDPVTVDGLSSIIREELGENEENEGEIEKLISLKTFILLIKLVRGVKTAKRSICKVQ